MPTYDYRCKSCKHEFEEFQKFSEETLVKCPSCGADALVRIIGGAGLVFKGSGFYLTDYKNKQASPDESKPKEASETTTAEKKSESGSAEKSASKPTQSSSSEDASSKGEKSSSKDSPAKSEKSISTDSSTKSEKSSSKGKEE